MYVRVKVTSGAKKEMVTKVSDTEFQIAVREPRERNLANRRVRTLVAEAYQVMEGNVRLISGHRSPIKVFDVET
jgi:uncharacterized protein YggU (UPF0235/DUF167 family)